MSPTDELRSAAVLLRRRAEAASSGPWEVGPAFGARDSRVYVRTEGAFDWVGSTGVEEPPPPVITCQVANVSWFRANATYIATMDPLVGLALAGLLEHIAQDMAKTEFEERPAVGYDGAPLMVFTEDVWPRFDWTAALALARLVNRGGS